ncbi:MAG: hypothetical protein ACREOZ_01650, partial [Gloeomargaritales cyanobacterium]
MVDNVVAEELQEKKDAIINNESEISWVKPLLPLLKAFVDAELVVMGHNCSFMYDDYVAQRTVQFCAFDFSSVSPPVDMHLGSNEHLEKS